MADGDEHVLQLAVRAQGVVGVVGDHGGQAGLVGQAASSATSQSSSGQQVVLELHVEAVAGADEPGEALERGRGTLPVTGQQPTRDLSVTAAREDDEAAAMLGQQRVAEARHALAAGQVGGAGQPAEVRVAGLTRGQQREVRPQLPGADAPQVFPARVAMARRSLPGNGRPRRLPCPGLDGRRGDARTPKAGVAPRSGSSDRRGGTTMPCGSSAAASSSSTSMPTTACRPASLAAAAKRTAP